ncbi:peptidase M24, structural domain-containing protein [Dunaliella salina]|uniref:Methionine aminopeptidase n=1 Tax=Dunaliella salina TaxID=3046 RepID=A0ABQ7GTT8_DUNSA|nr:peptidase M24, structural domain-containing protein [Dunaliella salina]|eukprot:KAF5838034.1 peptidase M24, structural domain-containing protein [Dunaliella salina]
MPLALIQAAWPEHKQVHAPPPDAWLYVVKKGKERSQIMPQFEWTGPLRPDKVSPARKIPSHIPKPDYYKTGFPVMEIESKQQNMVPFYNATDQAGIKAACRLGREILDTAHRAIRPGITTDEIDRIVHEATMEANAYPSPYNYFNFPKSVCTSVNEVICHGIPDARELQNGDIVNVDVTAQLNGYCGDLNETFVVGEVDEQSKKLIKTAHDCLAKAVAMCKPGVRYRDVGEVITKHAQANGMSVVRTYCGHGIGQLFHCAPSIPHYAQNKAVGVMKVGMGMEGVGPQCPCGPSILSPSLPQYAQNKALGIVRVSMGMERV